MITSGWLAIQLTRATHTLTRHVLRTDEQAKYLLGVTPAVLSGRFATCGHAGKTARPYGDSFS
jgi:hypothetical protein